MAVAATTLAVGDTLSLERAFDPRRALRIIADEKITVLSGSPTVLGRIAMLPEFESADLSSLKSVCVGGAPVPKQLMDTYREKKGIHLINCFGMTETCGYHTIQASWQEGEEVAFEAMDGGRVCIADQQGNPVPPGVPGEILFAGPAIMKRYWNNPQATSEAMHGEWLRTGDLGVGDALGRFTIIGRQKNLIISGAFNISPIEVNQVISRHPDVAESTVFGIPHPDWGEAVVAAVVLRPQSSSGADDIIFWCQQRLLRWKVPKAIFFMEELPINQGTKIDVGKLKKQFQDHFLAQ